MVWAVCLTAQLAAHGHAVTQQSNRNKQPPRAHTTVAKLCTRHSRVYWLWRLFQGSAGSMLLCPWAAAAAAAVLVGACTGELRRLLLALLLLLSECLSEAACSHDQDKFNIRVCQLQEVT